jgi:hypothetical protein
MPRASVISMLRLALACLALGLFAVVPAANAASTTQILRDCADDGVLQGDYTPAELRKARQNIPTDTDEYTDCRDVLARAAAAGVAAKGAGASGAGPGGSGGTDAPIDPYTDEGRAAVAEAARQGAPDPLRLGERAVVPGTAGLSAEAVRNELPTPLVVLLALLGAAALATLTPFVRRRGLGAAALATLTPFGRVIARFRR